MAVNPRNKGQFVQAGVPHPIPKIDGSWMSVDGMVDFDVYLNQADYPVLYAVLGDVYNDGGEGAGQFKTPKVDDWGLPEDVGDNFKWMIRF